ncbi:MAG: hypothetical protein IPG76_23805 [Acidobacteria bacterium]|nr:hypothetical protein [Acidobacteriota bacterium]
MRRLKPAGIWGGVDPESKAIGCGTDSGTYQGASAPPIRSRHRWSLEMAGGITPPPLAIISRNLGSCGEIISETIRHLFIHAGPIIPRKW